MKKSIELSFGEAFQKAASYCAYQERCKAEVKQKLSKLELEEDFTEKIILKLEDENYINEERFCSEFVRGKLYGKSWGKQKIKAALQQKQISRDLINNLLDQIDEEDYQEILKKVVDKKKNTLDPIDNPAKKNKLINFAVSKGFEYGKVLELVNEEDRSY
ncbi:MAG: RecX family transcriptional regulator [Flammeovirgaceae bacterium]|nr:RecX family transcriptional regulator [Flammeovirgaceae bacterium]